MLDGDLLERQRQRRGRADGIPLEHDVLALVGQGPGQVEVDVELAPHVERVGGVGGDSRVGGETDADPERREPDEPVQPEVAREVHRLEVDDGVGLDPGLQRHVQRPVLPAPVVANPRPPGRAENSAP